MKNKKVISIHLFVLFSFSILMLLVLEKDHMLRCGVLDDLTLNQHYLNNNFFQATFEGGYKFRPVANAIMWIIFTITRGNLYMYGYINIIFAALCANLIFAFVLDHTWYLSLLVCYIFFPGFHIIR